MTPLKIKGDCSLDGNFRVYLLNVVRKFLSYIFRLHNPTKQLSRNGKDDDMPYPPPHMLRERTTKSTASGHLPNLSIELLPKAKTHMYV